MTEHLIRLAFALLARLPLRLNHALGAAIGWCAWVWPTRMRRVSLINLELCFPERDERWRRRIARQSLMETGKALTEAPWLWRAGPQRIVELCRGIDGETAFHEAVAGGHGVFLASPHLGGWEFAGLYAATRGPMTSLYRPPRQQVLENPMREGRESTGGRLVPTTTGGIKTLKRALDAGHLIGILPDQTPKRGTGVFAPFFGHPAYTMVLLPRLAGPRRVPVLVGFARRLPRGRGYRFHCIRAPESIFDPDPAVAATTLNRVVEELVRQSPEQYAWSYRRFSERPPGMPSPYRR